MILQMKSICVRRVGMQCGLQPEIEGERDDNKEVYKGFK